MTVARWFWPLLALLTLIAACTASVGGEQQRASGGTGGAPGSGGLPGSGGAGPFPCLTGVCNGVCINLSTDATNCGTCGTVCPAGSACTLGVCTCQTGLSACASGCTNLATDALNCGACGVTCTAGQTCNNGSCSCPMGLLSCNGACTDVTSDALNCGACAAPCQTGQACAAGACNCLNGLTSCGSSCVDLPSSAANCGGCGIACTAGQVCSNGVCTTMCAPGQQLCGSDCVELASSVTNCGACGVACDAGKSCLSGACTCPQGLTPCGASCVNAMTDAANCGGCGMACGAGQVCSAGVCGCPVNGQILCGASCSDPQTDPNNCGACNVVCSGGTSCSSGSCVCPGGQTKCGNTCTNLQNDISNCGNCGNVCSPGATCGSGSCMGGAGGMGGAAGSGGTSGGGGTGGNGGSGGSGGGGTMPDCDYYVSTTGNDSNSGTSEGQPFRTVGRAQTAASAGDLVCIRGGTYAFTGSGTVGVVFNKAGQANNLIRYWAYPGEIPVFDLTNLTPSNRVTGLDVNTSYIHLRGLEVKGVRQYMSGQDSWGVRIRGNNNVLENLNVHHNEAPGVFITSGANNLILNCDSHHNYDVLESGGSGDGFGCHSTGSGNVMRGCRAYDNSDDGYDFINAPGTCLVEQSFAFRNGYIPGTTTTAGNGAGFKAGGYGSPPSVPAGGSATHTVRNCVAFGNRSQGFYANHHPGRINFYNNTAFRNSANYNMLDDNGFTSSHDIRNNVAMSPGTAITNFTDGGTATNNSWNLSVTVSSGDFTSVDESLASAPRQADGSLPNNGFMRLVAGSDLIDKGTNVGLPFTGMSPDLGAYER